MQEWIAPVCAVVVSVVLPFIINLCKNQNWSANVKRWVALIVSAIVGVCAAFLAGMPTPETLVQWVLSVIGGVQMAYAAFKSIGVTSGWLDALEGVGGGSESEE